MFRQEPYTFPEHVYNSLLNLSTIQPHLQHGHHTSRESYHLATPNCNLPVYPTFLTNVTAANPYQFNVTNLSPAAHPYSSAFTNIAPDTNPYSVPVTDSVPVANDTAATTWRIADMPVSTAANPYNLEQHNDKKNYIYLPDYNVCIIPTPPPCPSETSARNTTVSPSFPEQFEEFLYRDAPRKARRMKRTRFNKEQMSTLRMTYSATKYLSRKRRNELAEQLGLDPIVVKNWFQNRRTVDRKRLKDASIL